MTVKNFIFRENCVGSGVAGMKIAFLSFLTKLGITFLSENEQIMVSTPPPIIMGGLNLKIYQNFVETKFLYLLGDKHPRGKLKLYGGDNICYNIFTIPFP